MKQTKLESLVEAVINTTSGVVLAMCLMSFVVVPLWGFETSFADNLTITLMFTASSIIRSFLWRRFFNAGLHKVIQNGNI